MATRTSSPAEVAITASPSFKRLQTYFLFPFALDKEAIQEDHPEAWPARTRWIDGLDSWVTGDPHPLPQGMNLLGRWKRASYSRFDVESPAYAELLFFNSIVRHVFFDTNIGRQADEQENQLRCYTIGITAPRRLWYEGGDVFGFCARAEVTDLRLFLSAQGVGILSIGVSAHAVAASQALWVNRRLRKLYPVDAESVREGRTPSWLALRLEKDGQIETVAEERFESPALVGFYPPLASTVKGLLYFADYSREEYEPVLDENMLVYSYAEMNSEATANGNSAVLEAVLEDYLYLNHKHNGAIRNSVGDSEVLLGFTGHSWSMVQVSGTPRTGGEPAPTPNGLAALSRDDLAIQKAFHNRYYLMMVIAVFYRAVLLDFSERSALVARRLLQDQQARKLTLASIRMVNDFRTEFLNFSGYWHFDDLSCKQADNDLFRRLCSEYRTQDMKEVLANELRHMTEFVYNFYQLRTTDAVNRLALLSLIFGGGAVLTGFFGMNFAREFGQFLFEGEGSASWLHYFLVALVTAFVFGSLALGTIVVLRNWRDYFAILNPPTKSQSSKSLKRDN
jgi:hypothetical protein